MVTGSILLSKKIYSLIIPHHPSVPDGVPLIGEDVVDVVVDVDVVDNVDNFEDVDVKSVS